MTDHTQPPLPLEGLNTASALTGTHHPTTSHTAAAYVAPVTSPQRRQILALLADAPHTDDELLTLSGLSPNTARPRRVELTRLKLVEDSGQVLYNAKGLPCIIWQITSKGRTALAQQ